MGQLGEETPGGVVGVCSDRWGQTQDVGMRDVNLDQTTSIDLSVDGESANTGRTNELRN